MTDIRLFENNRKIYIYGSGDVAREVSYCLMGEPYNFRIEAFIVSDSAVEGEKSINGIPVISCNEWDYHGDIQIIVAVLEKYREEICDKLNELGIDNKILMTFESDLWCKVRGKSYAIYRKKHEKVPYISLQEKIGENILQEKENNKKSFVIYVAKSHMDKPIKEERNNYEYDRNIQVGAALTNLKISDVTDYSGDNISAKNREYCELTALYWIWKNVKSEYVGLCHYRRRFVLTGEDVDKLVNSQIDVVVTNPVVNVPNVLDMYKKNHLSRDWMVMVKGIEKLNRDYLESLKYVENSNYYFPYNMFIMRKDILDHYCEWLFPILEYCETMCEIRSDRYQRRYIGFLAERLMTVYLYHNRNILNVVFAEKHFWE